MEPKKDILIIVGPTCVGKTAFSIELAKSISGEIISSDSMQAYRHMDIISQKPTREEQEAVRHHLIDILDPSEEYSAAYFVKLAKLAIEEIIKRDKTPIAVGGSGLYVKALIDGLFPAPKKDLALRRRFELKAARYGSEPLHAELRAIDPEAASKIHPNDLRRIIRALEVFQKTGIPISKQKKMSKGIIDSYNVRIFGLIRPRKALYQRIEDRVEKMFQEDVIGEARRLAQKRPAITAKASLGYKEIQGYLDKEYSLEETKELLKKNTRHLAKKQMTWFKADERIVWIDLDRIPESEAINLIMRDLT